MLKVYFVCVWVQRLRLRFFVFLFFFFFHTFWDKFYCYGYCSCTIHEQEPQSLTCQTIFSPSVHTVHCLRIHKFHFSATFSLKMGHTVLFTHLKIILLQRFSVFSSIKTDHYILKKWEKNCDFKKLYISWKVKTSL